jgi:PAS domain S-box-containing protein
MKEGKWTYEELEKRVFELERNLENKNTLPSSEILLLNEEEYKNIIDFSGDAILITNNIGKIIIWNKALFNLTGIKQSDAIGIYLWDIQYQLAPKEFKVPDFKATMRKEITRFLTEPSGFIRDIYEQRIVSLDGTDKTVEFSSYVLETRKGKLLVSTVRDISKDKKAELALAQQKIALTKLNQFSVELSKITSVENLETFISKRIKEFTGAIGVTFSEYDLKNKTLIPTHIELESGLLDKIVMKLGKQIQKNQTVVNDFMYHEITKEAICICNTLTEVSYGAIPDVVGVVIQNLLKAERYIRVAYSIDQNLYGISILAISKDLSETSMEMLQNFISLATVSLRRKKLEISLLENEAHLNTVTQNAADIIIELDSHGIVLNASRVLPGYSNNDIIGKNFCDWAAPEYHIVMMQSLENVFSKAKLQSYQSRALGINHEIRWYLSRLSPVVVGTEVKKAILIMSDITDQRYAEEALRESEENYRVITQSSLDIIFIIDKFGKQLFFNESVERILGYQVNELIGRSFTELIPLERLPDCLSELKNIFLHQKTFNFSTQMYHKDGYLIDVEIGGQLVKLKGENAAQGTITDITKKKRAEEELKRSLNRNQALLGANPDMMFLFNSNCKIVDFHSESHDQLLVEPEIFLGKLLDDILPHEVLVITKEKVEAVLITGNPDYSTYEMQIGDSIKYFESRYVPCGNNEVLSIVRDITEQRLAEKALQLTKESYLDIFNSVSEAIYVMDSSGTFIDVNKGAEKMYLCSKLELIGQSLQSLAAPLLNDLDEIQNLISLVNETGEPAFFDFWAERKGGEIFPKEVIVNKGKYFGKDVLIVTARDITEKKQEEERMKFKNEELLNLNAEKDKFFSIVAHDLRSPFNSFLGLTQIMAEDLQSLSMAQIQNIAVSMSKSATNLYALLENLLAWSRLQRGMTSFDPKSFLLLPKISESLQLVCEMANRKGIETVLNLQEDLVVFADQNMLESTIRNVALNAVKFTSKGGRITISARSTSRNSIEISVKDTGIGMDREILDKLFRIDEHTSRVGTEGEASTGLGLLLSKDFIEKHGGRIWAESEEGRGSTFFFTLPSNEFRKQENFSIYSQN